MGLFSFIGDVGANLFGSGKDEAEEIKILLDTELPGQIKNLKAEFEKGVVRLFGNCDSQEVKEKAILLAGNVKGVGSVDDTYLSAPPAEEETEFYTVTKGDSLSKIAKTYYGNAMKYPVIFEANREVIKDPNLIYPGQQLRIPKLPQ